MKHLLRELPAIHLIKTDIRYEDFLMKYNIAEIELTNLIQTQIDSLRHQLMTNEYNGPEDTTKQMFIELVYEQVNEKLTNFEPYYLRRVINGTGTILHTNLGRAKLSQAAIEQVITTASNYSNLEYQIEHGKRGSRHDIIEDSIVQLTGAEAAMVVNNNAAAVYLILRALAKDKEVIVSRGQLVEIGGSFRVSSIMEESGAKLVEVGTTNKTHLFDYEHAINENTAMILKVHTSNFKTVGFTASVETDQMVTLTKNYDNLIFYEDLGSGALLDFEQRGVGDEPVVGKVLNMGVDIVSFSGDKLLGGPQAGIIAGRKDLIQKLKKHQLARVLRVDKMTLAALEGTLRAYQNGTAEREIPTVRDILATKATVEEKANLFLAELNSNSHRYMTKLVDETSQIGGGTMPTEEIKTVAVALTSDKFSSVELSERLRLHKPAIITRTKDDHVLLDFRTITPEETTIIVAALLKLERG